MPTAVVQPWWALSASVCGASHARTGLPNQDAVKVVQDGGGLPAILAVSDGHGSAKCFRSHVGSQLAVDAAVAALDDFATGASEIPPEQIQASAALLPGAIVRRWRAAVAEHHAANPIGESELAALEPAAAVSARQALDRGDPFLIYGATLVSALLGPTWLLCLQLGDGEILTVSRGAAEVMQPIAVDESLIANETTSLCERDAEQNFRLHFRMLGDSTPALLLLATDGYPNSFETPAGFRQVASDLLGILDQDGAESVAQALPGWLEESSRLGSGDDVSVAILYLPPAKEAP
ncbi:MAG TPA: PP2C family serine/threonine-protein phosphatase [Pirellulaceae bacterium]|nr:PP2C family serine/threonine-protein phosphatase [Pirellulaceae bacterium]